MAYVAVNKNGTEVIGNGLCRCGYSNYGSIITQDDYPRSSIPLIKWCDIYYNPDEGLENHAIELPKGSIKKLIGRELTWIDEPVEL